MLNSEEEKLIKVSAVSKYPIISISEVTLDYEELLVGKSDVKEVLVQNIGQVPAYFRIDKESNEDDDKTFTVDTKKGFIPPGDTYSVSFKFQPKLVGVCSNAHYKISCKGGNDLNIS